MAEQTTQPAFDRACSFLELPAVLATRPTTIMANDPILGHMGTFIVQTAKHCEAGWRIYLQAISVGGGQIQIVLPDKVAATIYRQRQSLVDRSRRKPKPKLSAEDRQRARVREARRVLREEKRNGK